ncbi:hypothetical protein CALVIDRAFT_567220 [Calocera viscosa TUFC12733]|uniref:WW domain-containing protein n=1 Tax=Calocera viscosa (strain TUFC12733) TaxID=1330018 RepID=A0A167IDF2_CALVF|nr:hypothetical protein CALVIDRAFT_567220 [Calocera viscosa TUFC12733]
MLFTTRNLIPTQWIVSFRVTHPLPTTSEGDPDAPPPFEPNDSQSGDPSPSIADRHRYAVSNWVEIINPSGQVYFYHQEAQVSTNLNIRDEDIWEDLVEGLVMQADAAQNDAYFGQVRDWSIWQLFVDSTTGSYESTRWTYISHQYRLGVGLGLNPSTWDHRNRLLAHAAYWSFLLIYPRHLSYHPEAMERAEKDFVTALVHGYADRAVFLGDRSTFIYSPASCERLMKAYSFCQSHSKFDVVKTTLIARAMYDICNQRINLKHGTPDAITTAETDEKPSYSLPRRIGEIGMMLIFLGGHRVYVQRLVSVERWKEIGDLMYQENVKNLMESLLHEWSDTNLLSAVFLAANMAFLALQTLTGWVETLILVSTILALTSLIIGLHHLWKHRVRIDGTWEEAYSFMTQGKGLPMDPLLVLGVVLAAPYIILVWCILLFAAGLVTFCVQASDTPVALGAVAASMLTVVVAVFLVYSKLRPPRRLPHFPVGKVLNGFKHWAKKRQARGNATGVTRRDEGGSFGEDA